MDSIGTRARRRSRNVIAVFALLTLLATSARATEPEAPRTPPAAGCMDARRIERVRVLEPGLLLVASADGRYQIGLMDDCESLDETADLRVISPGGWVCGSGEEFVVAPEQRCAIGSITTLTTEDYLASARAHDRRRYGAGDATVLEPMEVRERARRGRGFRGDTEYCFTQQAIRGWSTEGDDVLVTTSARRAGGHRRYRVELARSCPELAWAQRIEFRSAVGIGVVCGNPGDMIRVLQDEEPQTVTQPLDSGVVPRSGSGIGASLTAATCPISAVYADDVAVRD